MVKDRILRDPAFCLGLIVWAVAATILPLQLGLAGASTLGFVAYVAIAGVLLAAADAVLNPALYHRWSDMFSQAVFWALGLAVPALIAFVIGAAAAPARAPFQNELCAMAGIEGRFDHDDHSDSALEDAIEALDDCEPGG